MGQMSGSEETRPGRRWMGEDERAPEQTPLRELFDAMLDACIVTDDSGTIQEANRAAALLFCLPVEHLLETGFLLQLPEGARADGSAALRALAGGGSTAAFAVPWRHEGPIRQVAVSGSRSVGGDLIWLLRDVTDGVRAEVAERALRRERAMRRAAEASEAEARFLADVGRDLSVAEGERDVAEIAARSAVPALGRLCIVDVRDRSGALRRIAVHHAEEGRAAEARAIAECAPDPKGPIGRSITRGETEVLLQMDALACEQIAPCAGPALEHLGLGTAIVLPLRARRGVVGALTLFAPDPAGSCAARLLLAESFADRVALALANASRLQHAVATSAEKTDFIAVMSHEFRTPLTSIVGYADLLETGTAGTLTEGQLKHVDRLRAAAWHLSQLVDDILVFTRGEQGMPVELRPCDLGAVIAEAVAGLEPSAAAAGIRLIVEPDPAEITIPSDSVKLRQIVINLVGNGIKFTERGEVRVGARREHDAVLVIVADTGIGIEPEDQQRVFQPFWRGEHARARATGGAGLGLAVTRELVHRLGGDITLESRPGRGSTFTVRLPLA